MKKTTLIISGFIVLIVFLFIPIILDDKKYVEKHFPSSMFSKIISHSEKFSCKYGAENGYGVKFTAWVNLNNEKDNFGMFIIPPIAMGDESKIIISGGIPNEEDLRVYSEVSSNIDPYISISSQSNEMYINQLIVNLNNSSKQIIIGENCLLVTGLKGGVFSIGTRSSLNHHVFRGDFESMLIIIYASKNDGLIIYFLPTSKSDPLDKVSLNNQGIPLFVLNCFNGL